MRTLVKERGKKKKKEGIAETGSVDCVSVESICVCVYVNASLVDRTVIKFPRSGRFRP